MEGYFFPTGVDSWFELSGGLKTEGSRNRDSTVVRGLVSGDEVWPSQSVRYSPVCTLPRFWSPYAVL